MHASGAFYLLREEYIRVPNISIIWMQLQVCLQNKQIVPLPMVQATTNWQSSALRQEWSRQKHSHPGSLSEISFRLVNLLALLKTGEISDPTAIHRLVHEIDYDLQTWGEVVPTNWNYMIVDDQAGFENPDLPLKSHIYPNLRVAEDWNNMRIQRITVNRVLLRFSDKFCFPVLQAATAIIKQLSLEICASISSLRDSPRMCNCPGPSSALFLIPIGVIFKMAKANC